MQRSKKKQDKKWSKKEEYIFEMLNRKCNVELMKIDRNRYNTQEEVERIGILSRSYSREFLIEVYGKKA